MVNLIEKKTCGKCGLEKVLKDFYRDKSKPDGRSTICADCSRANRTRYRELNRDEINLKKRVESLTEDRIDKVRQVDRERRPSRKKNPVKSEQVNKRRRDRFKNDPVYKQKRKIERQRHRDKNKDKIRVRERERHCLRMYGISSSEIERLTELQRWKCKICGDKMTEGKGLTGRCVDHDHGPAGHVRGIICGRCNRAEALLRNPKIAQAMTDYMKSNELFYNS